MPVNSPTLTVTEFTGIYNKIDPQKLGIGGFVLADNVDIDETGGTLYCRNGQTRLSSTGYFGAYATFDKARGYAMTAAGALEDWSASDTPVTLRSGFSGYPYWAQIANTVFVGNENACWRINQDGSVEDNALSVPAPPTVTPVSGGTLQAGQYRFVIVSVVNGRESAPSAEAIVSVDGTQNIAVSGIAGQRIYVCPANSEVFGWWRDTASAALVYTSDANQLGEELRTNNLWPMPNGKCLTFYQGRLYCSVYDARTDQSVIYRSLPFWWDLCDPIDMKLVPGEVRAMLGLATGLLIGTDRSVLAMIDDQLQELADYGVPPGQSMSYDAKLAGEETKMGWIWTQRGLCKALPFLEVTPQFAPPSADWCGTAVVRQFGDERFVATLSPFGLPDNSV